MARIGIYSGTFDPPHLGHVNAARHALSALNLSELFVIPSNIGPHKQQLPRLTSADQRFTMLRIAFSGMDRITVSDLEILRGGVSYTYDTILQLRRQYPDDELILCMGTDMFLKVSQWKNFHQMRKVVSFGVFRRGGQKWEAELLNQKAVLEELGAKVYVMENPITSVSSSDLRCLLRFGCSCEYLPDSVEEYIRKEKLYGIGESLCRLSLPELEQAVVGLLKPDRVNHVLGCRETAAALARHWGADETDAARAGLLHDITKALDGPLQLILCRKYGVELNAFSSQNPKTLHALTGSLVAERIFGEKASVVNAIRSHTTGKANMELLEKIIYIADYMEPNRDFPGVETLRKLAYTDIDRALKMGLETTISVLKKQGREISPESLEALEFLNNYEK